MVTRDREEITSDTVQSPHDIDSHYRNKDGNKVRGYSINLTESCDKEELHLISQVDVRPANIADNHFLKEGVKQSQKIFTADIENLHADGAYQSPGNQQYCQDEEINFYLSGMHGAKGRYDLLLEENGELIVTDTLTGERIPVKKLKGQQKWGIRVSNRNRYFTQKEIDACAFRKQIQNIPAEAENVRNNVEATIFQFCYHYRHNKSKYRGLCKHAMWANIRCLWVNFARILKYVKQTYPTLETACLKVTSFTKLSFKTFISELNFTLSIFIAMASPKFFACTVKKLFLTGF